MPNTISTRRVGLRRKIGDAATKNRAVGNNDFSIIRGFQRRAETIYRFHSPADTSGVDEIARFERPKHDQSFIVILPLLGAPGAA